jgi:hypothetical protein
MLREVVAIEVCRIFKLTIETLLRDQDSGSLLKQLQKGLSGELRSMMAMVDLESRQNDVGTCGYLIAKNPQVCETSIDTKRPDDLV